MVVEEYKPEFGMEDVPQLQLEELPRELSELDLASVEGFCEQDVDAVVDADAEKKSAPDIEGYISAQQSRRLPRELNKSPRICILIRIAEQGQ